MDSVKYNTFSPLHFGSSIESTMVIDVIMSNNLTFHFGYGNTRGDDRGAMGVTLPGSPIAFLCKHRLQTTYSNKINIDAAEENRALWVKIARRFKMSLVDFESFIQLAAIVLAKATGIIPCLVFGTSEQWVSNFRAPVKTKIVTYDWM